MIKNRVERMENELSKLEDNIKSGEKYLFQEKDNPKFTTEEERGLLLLQLTYMKHYKVTLELRISIEKEKVGGKNVNSKK